MRFFWSREDTKKRKKMKNMAVKIFELGAYFLYVFVSFIFFFHYITKLLPSDIYTNKCRFQLRFAVTSGPYCCITHYEYDTLLKYHIPLMTSKIWCHIQSIVYVLYMYCICNAKSVLYMYIDA